LWLQFENPAETSIVRIVLQPYVMTCTVLFVVSDVGMAYELLTNSVVEFAVKALNEQAPFPSRKANVFTVAAVAAPETAVPLILLTIEVALFPVTSPPIVILEVAAGACQTALVPL
jgi:hypothetical protein